jgi:hypothetical protein
VSKRLAPLLAVPLLLAACGSAKTVTRTVTVTSASPAASKAPASVQQERVATLAGVAQRIYAQESKGTVDQAPLRAVERDSALVRAAAAGDAATANAEAGRVMAAAAHITGIRVLRGGRPLANVQLKFIVGGNLRKLPGVPGAQVAISIQDIIGYVSLVHRVTGAEVVVHGSSGHALSSLPAATHAKLPRSGRTDVAGRTYQALSFTEPGWAGERLTVWMLQPA